MASQPLPYPASEAWGHLPYLRCVSSGREWHSACPKCGDSGHRSGTGKPNRFFIQAPHTGYSNQWRGKCRRCGHQEFVDEVINDGGGRSNEAIAKAKKQQKEWEEKEREKQEAKLKKLRETEYYLRWHEEMTSAQRAVWKDQHGIPDWAINMHKLGYNRGMKVNGSGDRADALTIPYFWGGWTTDDIVTLQFRLIGCDGANKYRFLRDTNQSLFFPWAEDTDKIEGNPVLVFEGAKKAIVAYDLLRGEVQYRGGPVTMTAVPSKEPPTRLVKQLDEASKVIWLMDPDAFDGKRPAMRRLVNLAGWSRSLVVRMTDKIDDLIIDYGLECDALVAAVQNAVPYMGE